MPHVIMPPQRNSPQQTPIEHDGAEPPLFTTTQPSPAELKQDDVKGNRDYSPKRFIRIKSMFNKVDPGRTLGTPKAAGTCALAQSLRK